MLAWTVVKVLALGLLAKRLSASSYLWLRVIAIVLVFKAALDILGGLGLLAKLHK